VRQYRYLRWHKCHPKSVCDKPDRGRINVCLLQNPRLKSGALAGFQQPFPRAGMGFRGHSDEELRSEVGEFERRALRERMSGRKGDEERIVRYAFGKQLVAGERGVKTDKAEVDLVSFERLELLGAGHVEKI